MIQRGVEGIIIIPSAQQPSSLHHDVIEKIPFVALLQPMLGMPVDAVLVQERQGSRAAVEHLIGRGHRHILFISQHVSTYTLRERLEGYRNAMLYAGLKPIEVEYDASQPMLEIFLKKQLAKGAERATAALAANEESSLATIRAIRSLGDTKASSLRLVGFDDFPTADLLIPSISTIRTPIIEMATLAVNMLFGKIEHGETKAEGSVSLPVELVIRESSDCKPGRARSLSPSKR
jgi:LacI family transcriptional regulator